MTTGNFVSTAAAHRICLPLCIAAILPAFALFAHAAHAGPLGAEPAGAPVVQVAEAAVPVPRGKPVRKKSDAIGGLIAEASGGEDGVGQAEDAPDQPPPAATRAAVEPQAPLAEVTGSRSALSAVGLKVALQLLDDKDYSAALTAASGLSDPVDSHIVQWLVLNSTGPGISSARFAEMAKALAGWPVQTLVRRRFEQALGRESPSPVTVIRALGGSAPASDDGVALLAGAYVTVGRKSDAAAVIAPFWRDPKLSDELESTIRQEFGALLTPGDKKARMDALLYAERPNQALRAAKSLPADQQALADAVVAVAKKSSKAGALLDGLPASAKRDPLATYARIQLLRRADKYEAAAKLLLAAPRDPKVLVNPDAWWVERRLVSRGLIDAGDARTAYKIAAAHSAQTSVMQAEAEFHAGWYALEFLHDPGLARPHFQRIEAVSTMPLSQSRAEYWLGRTAVAAGNTSDAGAHFKRAAAYPTTFYGQLALARLGASRLSINTPPAPNAAAKARFSRLELVQAIKRLEEAKRSDRNEALYRYLAERLTDPTDIAQLTDLAEKNESHQLALHIGKTAWQRGLPVESLAYPTTAIPAGAKTSSVEKPMVYAIARQESAFNPGAVSGAGARGLLQLMPATAKHVAGTVGLPFSKDRLTSDPAYNATLGAAHLGDLVEKFGGSYVMTFASYNAGASRVYAWMKAYGDPRDPKVDVVNWIELIPFTETRNYVQRVMENVQVYRARLGSPALKIESDLKRGKG
ncbi:MAG: lytic transglycosylase domain-containing protein [Bauldia sp.]